MDYLIPKPSIESKVSALHERFNELDKQMKDLQFYKECCIDKFIEEVRGYYSMELPHSSEFYETLLNETDENYKRNRKFIQDELRRLLVKDAKIGECIAEGYDSHGFTVKFTSNKQQYELTIPMTQKINRYNAVGKYSDYVYWDIAEFKLRRRESAHSLTTVWSGYKLSECKYFDDSDFKVTPT